MNDRNTKLPGVHNLTTEKEKFDDDKELVEKELAELTKSVWRWPNDHEVVTMAPRDRGKDEQEDCRNDLGKSMAEKLTGLGLVLLMDWWPELPADGVIAEPLGVYIENLNTHWSGIRQEVEGHVDPKVLEQIVKICSDAKTARVPVPTVILLMKAIEEESGREEWKKNTELEGHRWLTTKVLHHELGHQVFQVNASEYVANDSNCATTMRAEAGANWFAWMIGSSLQRDTLKAFSDGQTEPYRAYRKLIDWAKFEPIAPGAYVTSMAVALKFDEVKNITIFDKDRNETPYFLNHGEALVAALPTWLGGGASLLEALQSLRAREATKAAIASIYGSDPKTH